MATIGVLASPGQMGSSPCVGGSAYSTAEGIRAGAMTAGNAIKQLIALDMARDNARKLIDNYRKQRDIADRSLKISEQQQGQLSEVFWPREEEFLNEFATPEDREAAEVLGRRYAGRMVVPLARTFAKAFRDLKCNHPIRCASSYKRASLQLVNARHSAIGTAKALGYSLGHAEYLARKEIGTKRRMQALAWGRGLIAQATALYGSAGRTLAAVGEQYSQQLGSNLNEFMTEYGSMMDNIGMRRQARERDAHYEQQRSSSAHAPASYGRVEYSPLKTSNDLGYQSSFGGAMNPASPMGMVNSDLTTESASDNRVTHAPSMSHDHGNNSDVGKHQVTRTGSIIWPVVSVGAGYVEVDMDQYPLFHSGHKSEGFEFGAFS